METSARAPIRLLRAASQELPPARSLEPHDTRQGVTLGEPAPKHRSAAPLVFTCVPLGCPLGQPSRHVCVCGHVINGHSGAAGLRSYNNRLARLAGASRRRWGLPGPAYARWLPKPGARRASPRGRSRPVAALGPFGPATRRLVGAQGPTQGCGQCRHRARLGGREAARLGRGRAASESRAGSGKTLKTEALQLPELRGRGRGLVCGTAAGRGPCFQQP